MTSTITTLDYATSADDVEGLRAIAETQGFCLVKNVLTPDQMARLLEGMKAHHATMQNDIACDVLSFPALRWILFEPHILKIARALLGPQLVYYGQSNVNYEPTTKPYNELHCDARGMRDDIYRAWQDDTGHIFQGYRFGIYFGDYAVASGGLKVAVGSHKGRIRQFMPQSFISPTATTQKIGDETFAFPLTQTPLVNIKSQPGDIVVWNLRTFHAAGAKMFAQDPTLAVHPSIEDALYAKRPHAFAPNVTPRNVVFFDYGAPVEEIDLYSKHRVLRIDQSRLNEFSTWTYDSADARAAAEEHGVDLRYDGIIVGAALQSWNLRKQIAGGAISAGPELERATATLAALTTRLIDLMARHKEFSPYSSLFSRDDYNAMAATDPAAAVAQATDQILARIAAAKATHAAAMAPPAA